MSVSISLSGVAELDKVFKGLPNQLTYTYLSEVHTLAAQPLVQRAQLLAPLGDTMNLTKSIGVEKDSFGKSDIIGAVRVGARRGRFRGNHAHLLEYGTRKRAARSGANRGMGPAKPFMRPAYGQTRSQVEGIIKFQLSRKIVSYIKNNVRG